MQKKILFFGFSVTRYGNPPYPIRLKEILAEQGIDDYEISHAALGGVSLECIPFITEHLKKLSPDLIFFEIATSHYALTPKDINGTKAIFLRLFENLSFFCKKIVFLLLPRKDIEGLCPIRVALNQLRDEHSFGLIEMRAAFDSDWDLHAVDTVHPSRLGIEKICGEILGYLQGEEVLDLRIDSRAGISWELALSNFTPHHKYLLLRLFEHSNFSVKAIPLPVDEILELRFDQAGFLHGVFYLMGPETSSLDIRFTDKTLSIRTFDQHSYYYRIGFTPFQEPRQIKKNEVITILSSENRFNTILSKDSVYKTHGIMNYPISFACSDV